MNAADSNQCTQCKQCSHKKRVVEDRSKRYEHTLGNFVVVLLIRFLMRNKWTHNHVPSLWVATVLKTRALNRTQPQLGEWTRGLFGNVCMFPKCESLDWNSHLAHILQKKTCVSDFQLRSIYSISVWILCEKSFNAWWWGTCNKQDKETIFQMRSNQRMWRLLVYEPFQDLECSNWSTREDKIYLRIACIWYGLWVVKNTETHNTT